MIDGTLNKPFFSRNMGSQLIGSDSNAQWHNEQKGVLLIDDYHKKIGNFDVNEDEELDDSDNDFDGTDNDSSDYDEDADIEEEYQRQLALRAKKHRRKQMKNLQIQSKKLSFEIDYDYFANNFWPRAIKKYVIMQIPPIVVYSEIMSVIKGKNNQLNLYINFI